MASTKVKTSESKIIEKSEKYYSNLLKGNTDKVEDEYNSLLKAYKKLNKRYMKIIKIGDSQQNRSFNENEKTKDNMKKLKSHAITKISDGIASQSKLKDKFTKDLTAKDTNIKKLKLDVNDLQQEVDKLNLTVKRYEDKNKELIKRIQSTEKKNFNFENILDREMLQANSYGYKFSFVMLAIDNLQELKKELKLDSKIDTLISAISRLLNSSVKKFDLSRYMENGTFYIIYHHTKKESIDEFIKKISVKKKMGKYNVYFRSGYSTYENGNTIDRLMNRCLLDFEKN